MQRKLHNISHKVTLMGFHVAAPEQNEIAGAGCFKGHLRYKMITSQNVPS